ncbi:MAG: hypothetical protein DKT66_03040 [Candidatus Melainabacteria bacterium]|nr:MAG: hypothetical protein DKT66_03040 [Candidatus Melainabacteria bacterium]
MLELAVNKKDTLIRALAALYLAILAVITCFMLEWMFKLPTIKYHDYAKYYAAAKIVTSNQSHRIYDLDYQNEVWQDLSHESKTGRKVTLEISPIWPPFLVPFGNLPILNAYWLWQACWISCGVIGIFSVLRSVHGSTPIWTNVYRTFILVIATLACLPEARGMVLGQPCWLILGFVAGFCAAFIAKRDIAAGIMLAISTLKFQYSPFLGIAALASRRWKMIIVAAVVFFALSVSSASIIGADTFIHGPLTLLQWDSNKDLEIDINPQSMVNFRGILSTLLSPEIAMKSSFFLMLTGLLLTLKVWLDAIRIGSKTIPWALSFTVAAFLLFSAHVHMYECVVLVVLPALTFPTFDPVKLLATKDWRMRAWIWLLVSYPILLWFVFLLDVKLFHIVVNGSNLSVLTVFALNLINVVLLLLAAANLYGMKDKTASEIAGASEDLLPTPNQ